MSKNLISNALGLVQGLAVSEQAASGERLFRGIPVSQGVCRGKVFLLEHTLDGVPRFEIPETEIPCQMQRLEQALIETRHQILEVQRKVRAAMGAGDASIFDAHLLILEDPTLLDEVVRVLNHDHVNIEYAFHVVTEKFIHTLGQIDDEYLRERAADMRDVTSRVLNNLLGRQHDGGLRTLTEPSIVVSHDLRPSTTAQLDKRMVLGFATDSGSQTSHTAIMARSMGIPAVVGLHDVTQQLHSSDYVLLDGYNGLIITNPTDQTLFEYGQLVQKKVNLQEKLKDTRDQPAITLDGARVVLAANIEQAGDVAAVQGSGAEGVGLFRTEYLYLNRDQLPTEEEQFEAYRTVAATLHPHPVVIRTLDLGGDKFLAHLQLPQEMNPFLGWRAIRFCLQEKDIFRAQLRAILRASAFGNVKMMYPMISGVGEMDQANQMVEECRADLRARGIAFNEQMEIGAMIEIPSAAMVADALARRSKFFSIGTNDLIQYSLAVDRLNDKIAHLYEPTHPAVLRLIKNTVEAAHRQGRWVGVCGEMAGDPILATLLLGLGVDELSASATLVPQVKFIIRRLKMTEARELAEFALNCETAAEILDRCRTQAWQIAPGLFENEACKIR